MKNEFKYITIFAFLAAAALISALLILPQNFFNNKKKEFRQTRYIKPVLQDNNFDVLNNDAEIAAIKESERVKINLEDGELVIAALSEDFDKDGSEEQVIAYRNLLEENNPVYITYIDYAEDTKQYRRLWSAATAVTRPGTASLFTQDLIGDRSVCVILSGMNANGEHTMTIFKVNPGQDGKTSLNKIADIKIDGTISIIEKERTQAYQLGLTNGASFDIKGRSRNVLSSNEFDQIEVTYSYNPGLERYTQSNVARISGAQIEAARFRSLLNGGKAEFEQFIQGLWYLVAPDMSINNSQYIYFDTAGHEIIFYDKNTQQVYTWISSTSTRYGLYISSQNISVATLRRVMDIELESIDVIRVKVFEDVRMKIGLNAPWDGSYRKAVSIKKTDMVEESSVKAYIDAEYNSSRGNLIFSQNGEYQINVLGLTQKGRYAFFKLKGQVYLELMQENADLRLLGGRSLDGGSGREIYRVEYEDAPSAASSAISSVGGGAADAASVGTDGLPIPSFSLQRVRLSVRGEQDFHEDPVIFNLVEKSVEQTPE
ncbi:MAG: pallilysin-related adhesin [Spirochaetaceae bacterium]|jgi:hypothetical protein|nr:pallilysin-related adhesin [Spirochaetaceae bacterium]